MKISVIVPTLGRHEQLLALLKNIDNTTVGYEVEIIVVNEEQILRKEIETLTYRSEVRYLEKNGNAVEKWNYGAKFASGDWLVLGADDLYFHSDWLVNALSVKNSGFIGFNDQITNNEFNSTHFMMTPEYMKKYNGGVLAIPVYQSWYFDQETCDRAKSAGMYAYSIGSKVDHNHWSWGKATKDETYEIATPKQVMDRDLFLLRHATGFPNNFSPVIK